MLFQVVENIVVEQVLFTFSPGVLGFISQQFFRFLAAEDSFMAFNVFAHIGNVWEPFRVERSGIRIKGGVADEVERLKAGELFLQRKTDEVM